jgi:hypothetical protein
MQGLLRSVAAMAGAIALDVPGCCAAAGGAPLKPVTIAPGVVMPVINNGAITNGSWFPNNTLEKPGIETWLRVGGRGVDTAWCYHNQPQVGAAIANSTSTVPRDQIFVTTKACTLSPSPAHRPIRSSSLQYATWQPVLLSRQPAVRGGCDATDPVHGHDRAVDGIYQDRPRAARPRIRRPAADPLPGQL